MACTTALFAGGDKPPARFNPLRSLRPILLLAVIACTACSQDADVDQAVKQNVAAFYRLHEASPTAGALSLSELMRFRQFLSVALFEKLKDASMAEESFFQQNADTQPPLFEGDLFTARPQGFSAARVFNCTIEDEHAYCNIDLNAAQGADIIKWKERLFLVKEAHGWVIDDIDYGHNNPPLHDGRLTALLANGIQRGHAEIVEPPSP
jgi:hypothetical protein